MERSASAAWVSFGFEASSFWSGARAASQRPSAMSWLAISRHTARLFGLARSACWSWWKGPRSSGRRGRRPVRAAAWFRRWRHRCGGPLPAGRSRPLDDARQGQFGPFDWRLQSRSVRVAARPVRQVHRCQEQVASSRRYGGRYPDPVAASRSGPPQDRERRQERHQRHPVP